MKDDHWRIPDRLWARLEALLPARPRHPPGCHNPRVPDRMTILRRRQRKSCRSLRSIRPALTERRSTSELQEWRSSSSLKP